MTIDLPRLISRWFCIKMMPCNLQPKKNFANSFPILKFPINFSIFARAVFEKGKSNLLLLFTITRWKRHEKSNL